MKKIKEMMFLSSMMLISVGAFASEKEGGGGGNALELFRLVGSDVIKTLQAHPLVSQQFFEIDPEHMKAALSDENITLSKDTFDKGREAFVDPSVRRTIRGYEVLGISLYSGTPITKDSYAFVAKELLRSIGRNDRVNSDMHLEIHRLIAFSKKYQAPFQDTYPLAKDALLENMVPNNILVTLRGRESSMYRNVPEVMVPGIVNMILDSCSQTALTATKDAKGNFTIIADKILCLMNEGPSETSEKRNSNPSKKFFEIYTLAGYIGTCESYKNDPNPNTLIQATLNSYAETALSDAKRSCSDAGYRECFTEEKGWKTIQNPAPQAKGDQFLCKGYARVVGIH